MSLTTSASVPVRAPTRPVRWPGLVLALAGGLAGWWVHTHVSQISAPVVAVVLGVLVGNSALASHTAAGLRVAGRRFIRTGVVLLGLRISVGEVFDLGPALLAVVVLVVAITFVGTRHLGRRMGLSPGFSLLVATGWSICGASAIAAVEPLAGAEDEEVAYSVAMVTLCGSLAIVVLPVLAGLIGVPDAVFGAWTGASVHDVGQVVATASTRGDAALTVAVVVKLTRVALLAPLLASVGWRQHRAGRSPSVATARRAPVPAFLLAFLVAVTVRSTGWLSTDALGTAKWFETVMIAAGLVGLGGQVVWTRLRRLGGRPLALGLASWALVAAVSLPAVWLAN